MWHQVEALGFFLNESQSCCQNSNRQQKDLYFRRHGFRFLIIVRVEELLGSRHPVGLGVTLRRGLGGRPPLSRLGLPVSHSAAMLHGLGRGYLLDSGSPGIRTEFVMLKLGPSLFECSFAKPKLTGRGGYSRGVCLEEPRWSIVSAGIQSRGSGGREGHRCVRVLLQSARPLPVERSGGN